MTKDKFIIPVTPKTYEVKYVENKDQEQIKKSPLSASARSKVINRSGSNYVSENQESYGPCLNSSCNCSASQLESQIRELQQKLERRRNFRPLTITLVDRNNNSRSKTVYSREDAYREASDARWGVGNWSKDWNFSPSAKSQQQLAEKIGEAVDYGYSSASAGDRFL
ncbi:hypothetical protein [endosymbiont GvMRE of Glomus versiforme]|uniref:hypothetical protein n=1 Tax=endosymbiont GvMRE of Glomus versiforme TaxID=2039283 RepID=UPI000EE33A8F|nr:hypothetical protein [endosymbiont GvMRE of Glomus versiforme]RHZ36852.1 hypothetical protein GvMRE_I2g347 [endosymbiont GvMRE of Glomus versiforme]